MRRSLRGKPDVDNSDAMRLRVERLAIIQLSGDHRAAQIQPAQRPFVSCIGDYQSAVSLTEHFVGGDEELEAYLNLLAIRAKSLIEFHWDDVIAVADALLERRSLTAPQVRQILRM